MNPRIEKIKSSLAPYRAQILYHPLYAEINTLEDLHVFMQHHVFAVWDFMSLLKSIQRALTCVEVPWFPKKNANTSFLINEIVVGEESDIDLDGNRKSHFELYLDAMQQAGANNNAIIQFIDSLKSTGNLATSFANSNANESIQNFVNFTFDVIHSEKPHLQAAIFTFGREDLIPGMFMALIEDFYSKIPHAISKFKYYLDRHIEVDGGQHGTLALEMIEDLCGEDEELWAEVEQLSIESLKKRKMLWDEVHHQIVSRKSKSK
jgi:hypothetical protein